MGTVLVNGCGISAICDTIEGLNYWISEIIYRGGVPQVMRWAGAL